MESDHGQYILFQPAEGKETEVLGILRDVYSKMHTNGQQKEKVCGAFEAHKEIFYFTVWEVPPNILEEVKKQCKPETYEAFTDYFGLEEYIRALLSKTESMEGEATSEARERALASNLRRAQHEFH